MTRKILYFAPNFSPIFAETTRFFDTRQNFDSKVL